MKWLAVLTYDGTDLAGFQLQKEARTVQGELERALEQVTGETVRVTGGGRTDAGVHALGQGASFTIQSDWTAAKLQRALNAVLPRDIALSELEAVGDEFSARYSAGARFYRYTILNTPQRSPLHERYALHVAKALDERAMNEAVKLLLGEHDFRAFGKPPHGENSVRTLIRAEVRREGEFVIVELEANAFLYRMARRIVGTLVLVGLGGMNPGEIRQVLGGKKRAGTAVKPQGLCLVRVKYDSRRLVRPD